MSRTPAISAAVALLLACLPVAAHHGFTGRYDTDRPIWLTGTVVDLATAPPHPTMTLRVDTPPAPPPTTGLPVEFTAAPAARPEDAGRVVSIEFAPVGAFFNLGGQLKAGDRVEVLALRNCRAPHQIRSQWLRLSSGAIIQREGRLSYMAQGCGS